MGRKATGLKLAIGALMLLAVCEIVILQRYVGAVQRLADLTIELEYAKGSAMLASAKAQRCDAPPDKN